MASDKALAAERARIDAVDARIVSLLNERAKIVQQIGRIKQKGGMPVVAPGRVEEVLRKVTGHNTGPLSAAAMKRIYERIIEEMTALESKNGS
ncbi:MAG: chorismate mutase [Acidobacteria bacterium]|nr:chorismate mutase [Acidobacteriota bacterium]